MLNACSFKMVTLYIFSWQDDEEGDMYEAPPCERPAVKVPQRQVEENVYLGNNYCRYINSLKPCSAEIPRQYKIDLFPKILLLDATFCREDVQSCCSTEAGCSSTENWQSPGNNCFVSWKSASVTFKMCFRISFDRNHLTSVIQKPQQRAEEFFYDRNIKKRESFICIIICSYTNSASL